jgi:hypothetical protein
MVKIFFEFLIYLLGGVKDFIKPLDRRKIISFSIMRMLECVKRKKKKRKKYCTKWKNVKSYQVHYNYLFVLTFKKVGKINFS